MLSTPSPNNESKIFLKDFEKACLAAFSISKFSSFQLKAVFLLHAQDQHRGVELSFISLRDFKDLYYPHRAWKGDYRQGLADSKTLADKHKKELKDKQADEEDNISEASMLLEDIMQGKAVEDIRKARDQEDTKAVVEEELRRKKVSAMKDDYETASNFSERIDNIIAIKSSDPKLMKYAEVKPPTGDKAKKG